MDMPEPLSNDQFGMGQEPQPGDMGAMPEAPADNGVSEIDDVFSQLDTEKQAAVLKYAKSMIDNSPEETPSPSESVDEEEMVTEITNNILDGQKQEEGDGDKKVRNKKVTTSNPFITKSFSRN